MRYLILFIHFFLLIDNQLQAQFYEAGQNPPSVKWYIIDKKEFSLIFPEELKEQAFYLSNYLSNIIQNTKKSYSLEAKKFPIILHNRSVIANGFVTLAPKRSEWYALPPQNIYAQPWLEQLALHEYRHIMQISQFYRGFTKYLQIPFGQIAIGSVVATFIPRWLIEGDAVLTETLYSNSGRGRLPEFSAPLKAQLLEKKIYSYNKACFGSYKDFVPDVYTLGYFLTGFSKLKYGTNIYDNVFSYTARYPFLITPFAIGIKKNTNKTPIRLYKETITDIKNHFANEINNDSFDYKLIKVPISKIYTNYYSPLPYKNNVIALKTSFNEITQIVNIDTNGSETIIHKTGFMPDKSISILFDKITWAEYEPDIRWDLQSFSVIKIFDLEKNKARKITHKTRLFSPSFNFKGDKIVCIENNLVGNTSLVIICAYSGKIIQKINTDNLDVLSYPSWNKDGDKIISVITNKMGKSLIEFNLTNNEKKNLLPFSYNDIKYPQYYKNFIIFTSTNINSNEILAYDTLVKKYYLLTNSKFGSYKPYSNNYNSEILYTVLTADGYKIACDTISNINFKEVELSGLISTCFTDSLKRAYFIDTSEKNLIENTEFKRYKPLNNLINIHSWAPLSIDAEKQNINTGVSIMSQNLLSTLFITAGYEYLQQERNGKYYLNISYKGLFPVIDFTFDYKERTGKLYSQGLFQRNFSYKESASKIGVRLPLKFSTGKYYSGLQPSIKTQLIQIIHDESTPFQMIKGLISSFDYRLYGYHILRTAYRDINPRWGQIIDINLRHSPLGKVNYGNISSLETWLYFPSFFSNHSIMIYSGFQKKKSGEKYYRYSDLINYPYGTSIVENEKMGSAMVSYTLPLFYPDLSLGSLIYLKRIHTVLSASMLRANFKGKTYNLSSYSGEIHTEFHFLRFLAPFQLGYRYSFLPESKSNYNEILFNINFRGLAPKN